MSRERCILFVPPTSSIEPAAAALTPLFGLRLIERTALAFQRAGVREFVVIGDAAGAREVAGRLAEGRIAGMRVRALGEDESLLPLAGGDTACFVARADVLYDRRLVARFVEETRGAEGTVAAVDFRADALAAQDGAPRVAGFGALAAEGLVEPRSHEGLIEPRSRAGHGRRGETLRAAGQGLLAPAGVFTGLARVTAGFARALEDAPPDCRSLANALTLLARREPVATWAVAELWQGLRAEDGARQEDLARARRKVLAGAVGIADGVVARHLNRPLSRRITERLLSRDVKPWQVSVASFFAVLGAGLSFALGHATTGGLVAQFASILDGVDGELARIRYQDSPFGGVYDALLDRVGDAALIGGMTLYAWLMGAGLSAVALGFAAMAGSSLSMLVKEKYGTQYQRPWRAEREGRLGWLLLGRDGRLFLILVAGLTGWVEVVLGYLAVGTHLHAGVRLYRIRSEASA